VKFMLFIYPDQSVELTPDSRCSRTASCRNSGVYLDGLAISVNSSPAAPPPTIKESTKTGQPQPHPLPTSPEPPEPEGPYPEKSRPNQRPRETTRPSPAYNSRRPASARPSVTSSAYSRSPPTGSPLASRVTRTESRSRSAM
jgi:hypothetical protein